MIKKQELSLNVIKTFLKLYEEQEKLKIFAVIKNNKTNNKYLYKDGNFYE